MSKSKQLTVTSTDPRKRMLEIRLMVKNSVKTGARVDLLPLKAEDKARAMIALQDLLEAEKGKHRKAREHIMTLKNMLSALGFLSEKMLMASVRGSKLKDMEITRLNGVVENATEECNRLSKGWQDQCRVTEEVLIERDTAHENLEATLQTLRITL